MPEGDVEKLEWVSVCPGRSSPPRTSKVSVVEFRSIVSALPLLRAVLRMAHVMDGYQNSRRKALSVIPPEVGRPVALARASKSALQSGMETAQRGSLPCSCRFWKPSGWSIFVMGITHDVIVACRAGGRVGGYI